MKKINSETGELIVIAMMVIACITFVWIAALFS